MTLVAGVDSSTQSVKVVVCDLDTGAVVRTSRAAHPTGTEVSAEALAGGLRARRRPIRGCSRGSRRWPSAASSTAWSPSTRPASWYATPCCGTTTAPPGTRVDLIAELGGAAAWADAVGSVPVASMTVSKIRWLARAEPDNAARTASGRAPARLADLADRRPQLRAGHRPRRRVRHLLLRRDRQHLSRRPRRLALGHDLDPAPGRRPGRDRRSHSGRHRPRARHRRQHGGRAGARTGPRRRRGLARAPAARPSPAAASRPTNPPAPSRGSPTPPGSSCRWSAP